MEPIENVVLKFFSSVFKNIEIKIRDLKKKGPGFESERTKFITDLEEKIRELKKQVKDAKGWECPDSTCIGKLIEEKCANTNYNLFRNNLTGNVGNIVDLSVTGLTTDSLPTFWSILENFENLTSLGVAVTNGTVITLPDFKDKLKKLKENLKKLQMKGSHSGLEKLGELGELLRLRLYGVCQEETCTIELKELGKLKKLVIGHMEKVKTVQISSAVLKTVVTLKFSNLPKLEEVTDTNKKALFSGEVNPNCPGLKIYHYDEENQCYKLKATQNKKG